MSEFTKTIIVDAAGGVGSNYTTIKEATQYFIDNEIGGVIIVEQGIYDIDGTGNKITIPVPSNTTIIGRGNVVVRVTNPGYSAFRNAKFVDGNNHITLSGFKIVVACNSNSYNNHLIWMQNVSDCLIEKITIEAPSDINPYGIVRGSYAILLYSFSSDKHCHSNIIRQCVVREFGTIVSSVNKYGYGIGLTRQKDTQYFCCDTIVKNNHVSGCLTSLYCSFAERIIIQGNIFTRNKEMNISFDQVKNSIISGNQINETAAGTGSHGFYPSGCEGLIISGNIVCENRECGIKPRFAGPVSDRIPDKYYTINGNVCNDNGKNSSGNGILLEGLAQRMTLFGNACYNNTNNGIRLQIEKGSWMGTDLTGERAQDNLVACNVAVLHGNDKGTSSDQPISIEDSSNCQACNLTGKLP